MEDLLEVSEKGCLRCFIKFISHKILRKKEEKMRQEMQVPNDLSFDLQIQGKDEKTRSTAQS